MLSWNLKVGKYCSTTENVKINNHKVFQFWKRKHFFKNGKNENPKNNGNIKKVNPRYCSDMGEMGEIEQ